MAVASQFFIHVACGEAVFQQHVADCLYGDWGLSVKCLGYFAEEAIRQFGCSVYQGNTIVAEVTC
jgi:hypothetical protein